MYSINKYTLNIHSIHNIYTVYTIYVYTYLYIIYIYITHITYQQSVSRRESTQEEGDLEKPADPLKILSEALVAGFNPRLDFGQVGPSSQKFDIKFKISRI